MTIDTTIDTTIGPVTVLHRLALGAECLDALVNRLVLTSVRLGREVPAWQRSRPIDPSWPCLDLEASGPARFKLRHRATIPATLVVRVDDPTRHYVPRRFTVHLWPVASLDEASGQPYVPVRSRLLRSWLWPGSAAALPRSATMIRGRVVHGSAPVRWARLTAIGPTNEVAGRAHADDRGEFVLVISDPAQNPVQSTVAVSVSVIAPKVAGPINPLDRCADLVVEDIPRSSAPPAASDLDNDVLRGVATPAGYSANANGPRAVIVQVGSEVILADDIVFDPQP
jgi:hypothetical protein